MGGFSGSGVVLLHGDGDLGRKGGSSWSVRGFSRSGVVLLHGAHLS